MLSYCRILNSYTTIGKNSSRLFKLSWTTTIKQAPTNDHFKNHYWLHAYQQVSYKTNFMKSRKHESTFFPKRAINWIIEKLNLSTKRTTAKKKYAS